MVEEKAQIYRKGKKIGVINKGDRIIRNQTLEYLELTHEWNLESFYKGHIGEIRKVLLDLDIYEKAFLMSITPYVGYEDCCIKYDNGNTIGTEDMIKLSGLKRARTYETIKSLIKKDIIYKGKNSKEKQYFINPWLFCKGHRINKVLQTMFQNYKVRVLGGVPWKNIK
jgi:hypothetical protein